MIVRYILYKLVIKFIITDYIEIPQKIALILY
jgi:hypothetical protein